MMLQTVRQAHEQDLGRILDIYNQGIEDRIATLETEKKDQAYIGNWLLEHQGRYTALVAEDQGEIAGWAALNRYSHRCAYDGVADLSIYVDRAYRGKGIGSLLLPALEESARKNSFYKIVLFTFPFNAGGQALYRKNGYREVGVFEKQGRLDGRYIDVMIMEKLL
ncbi:arsinothricin resistance N-acetyltransferase ArsN1 family A [Paenibacillus tarimensis]|uniref:arsinothricin resistance N-acetyltransferase ArsN1 family A n=1 Tax=Paenibacillus tarimensis TaxID=416012 RepID=UPI001F21C29D|nr:arsinothricin resistance N-acetyltransferase ArsN1 family A [Paenibacillus tarimensis]MCF2945273.1 arsinothricin resistance N-acetyltransferase ArsN1 [Paenibacillus tarimensis]